MPFNSYEFIFVFLPASVAGFWLIARHTGRAPAIVWLLLASAAFYVYAGATNLAITTPLIVLNYLIARAMLRLTLSRERLRRVLFVAGVATNVAFLGYFKYTSFFLETANTLLATHFDLKPLILPLGISFITFQNIAFLCDVQSQQVKAFRFFDFLLFTLFFPRAIAGPIIHYEEVVPQLVNIKPRRFMTDAAVAVSLFSIGLFKKTVISDGVARFEGSTFDFPWDQPLTLLNAWIGVLAFTFHLYFDFSGYSDMALGIARMFGVRLPMNFNSPFKARSILEFWGRWHITLTRFLTAYAYTPIVLHLTRVRLAKGKPVLEGKRSTPSALAILVGLPTIITMAISGVWHGAGWQFVVWGLLHGTYLTINQIWRILRPRFWPSQISYERVMKPVGFALTFCAVVTAFVFFRASSVTSALLILGSMVGSNGILPPDVQVLQNLYGRVPWSLITFLQPIEPFVWIFILFLAVTLLPNSLQLLRRFQPALDFPDPPEEPRMSRAARSSAVPQHAAEKRPHAGAILRRAWAALRHLEHQGISLNHVTATITALLCVLGIIALGRSDAFVYGKF